MGAWPEDSRFHWTTAELRFVCQLLLDGFSQLPTKVTVSLRK